MEPMRAGRKELFVIGDRVLIEGDEGEGRTRVGLLLPPGALDRESVQSGHIVARGPGIPLPPPDSDQEPWQTPPSMPRYLTMQVEVGDFAVFFRKAAIEITFEDRRYLVVPQAAILAVVREPRVPDRLPDEI